MATPEEKINVIVSPINNKIIVRTPGPQGIPGITGGSYVHSQPTASNTWNITHNLGYYPSITVVDSAGTVVEGSYQYTALNTVIATFIGSFSGKAYLS